MCNILFKIDLVPLVLEKFICMQEKIQKWTNDVHRRQWDMAGGPWAHMLRRPKDKLFLTKSSMGWLWHRRLGHVGMKQLNRLVSTKDARQSSEGYTTKVD